MKPKKSSLHRMPIEKASFAANSSSDLVKEASHISEQATTPIHNTHQYILNDTIYTVPIPSSPITEELVNQNIQAYIPQSPVSMYTNIRDEELLLLQTLPIRAMKKIEVKKKAGAFFRSIITMFLSIPLFGVLVTLIVILPDPMYKVEISIVLLVAFSYIASVQMRYISRMRRKGSPSTTQIMQTVNKKAISAKDRDIEHFKLIKQDTTSYLRALTTKDLKKGSRS